MRQVVELYEHDDDLCARGCGRGCSQNQYNIGYTAAAEYVRKTEVAPLRADLKRLQKRDRFVLTALRRAVRDGNYMEVVGDLLSELEGA